MQDENNTSKSKGSSKIIDYKVLFYLPNIIGYIRLLLVLAAFYNVSSSVTFLLLYSTSITLDAFDGVAARKFKQASLFGAWLDVVIDNIGRGLLWTHLHPHFYIISVIEWLAFVCNHQLGPNWKQLLASQGGESTLQDRTSPIFVSRILSNNFRNFWGVWSVAGLHVLPVWIFGIQRRIFAVYLDFLPPWISLAGVVVLSTGRGICFVAEFWSIWFHVSSLLVKHSRE